MISIEKANTSNVTAVAKMENKFFSGEAYDEVSLSDEFLNPNRLYFVAKNNEEVIGYVGVNVLPDLAEILKIAVAENCRQQGVASKLLQTAIEHCKLKKVNKLQLEVSEQNLTAIAFYKKMGFAHIHTRKQYYSSGANALILSREI